MCSNVAWHRSCGAALLTHLFIAYSVKLFQVLLSETPVCCETHSTDTLVIFHALFTAAVAYGDSVHALAGRFASTRLLACPGVRTVCPPRWWSRVECTEALLVWNVASYVPCAEPLLYQRPVFGGSLTQRGTDGRPQTVNAEHLHEAAHGGFGLDV